MGKYVNGIHGAFTGKVGNIIGSSWRGIPYMKSRPIRTKPPTEREKQNRFIFGMTQQWLHPLTDFLRIGFKNYTHTNQGVNAAKSYLHKHALIRNGYDSVIDPTLMKVSHGDLPFPDRMEVELNSEDELVLTWEPAKSGSENEFDQILILAYDIDGEVAEMSLNGQFRKTGRDVLEVEKLNSFVVYAAFVSADRSSQSDSVYLGNFARIKKKKTPDQKTASKKETASVNKITADSGNTETAAPDNTTTTSNSIAAVAYDNTTKDENQLPGIASGRVITLSEDADDVDHAPENQLSLFDSWDKKIEDAAETANRVVDPVSETNANTSMITIDNPTAAKGPTDMDQSAVDTDGAKETILETHKTEDQEVENINKLQESVLINESMPTDVSEMQVSNLTGDSALTKVSEPKQVSALKDGTTLKDEAVLKDISPLGNHDLTETERKASANQKFTYINPNATAKDKKPDLSVRVDPEADKKGKKAEKRVKLKKDRLTVFTTEEKAEQLKREGYRTEN